MGQIWDRFGTDLGQIGEAKKLISSGRARDAIVLLFETISPSSPHLKELKLLQSQYARLKSHERLGVLSSSEQRIESNRVLYSLLSLIAEIEKTELNQAKNKEIPKYYSGRTDYMPLAAMENQGHYCSQPERKKILFQIIGSASIDGTPAGRALKEVTEELDRSGEKDEFELVLKISENVQDLGNDLRAHEPNFLHLFISGSAEGLLLFDGERAGQGFYTWENLAKLVEKTSDSIQCLLLNSGIASSISGLFTDFIPYVIAWEGRISEEITHKFWAFFYKKTAEGRSIPDSFEFVKNLPEMNFTDHDFPVLISK